MRNIKINLNKMKGDNKFFITFVWGILSTLIFILQSVLISDGQYNSKKFKETIKNWKNTPILDISIYSDEKYYKEKDSIKIGSTKLYLRKMDKKYNYPHLLVRSKNLVSKKVCGKDNNGNDIYFPAYEECPINYLEIKNDCDPINFKCIRISSGEYLVYSNKFNSKNIIVNVSISRSDDLVYDNYIGINNTDINDISDKMENLLSITSKLKKKIFLL